MFLWQVKLALLLEARAGVALTQDLEGRPMFCELLRDTALGRDDGLRGLLSLAGLESWRTPRGAPDSPPPADGGGGWGAACSVQSYCCKRSPCKRLSVQRGGESQVVGSCKVHCTPHVSGPPFSIIIFCPARDVQLLQNSKCNTAVQTRFTSRGNMGPFCGKQLLV